MKYDDASWHYGGDFPQDLPNEAGATHIGMFLAWALLTDLGGELHVDDCPGELAELKAREVTPGQYFIAACDEKLTDEDLSEEGNAFAQSYYDGEYISDYIGVVAKDMDAVYRAEDTWDNFDLLKPVIDKRFEEWRRAT